MNPRSAAFHRASAALREGSQPRSATVRRVKLDPDQIKAGESFGGLLRAMREERGLTVDELAEHVERLLVKGRVWSVDIRDVIATAEKAAACTMSPWIAGRVWMALVRVGPASSVQAARWTSLVRVGDGA